MEAVGNIVIITGVAFMLFGIVGIFRFDNFYSRILVTGKIDTVGALTIVLGIAIKSGLSFFALKLLLLAGIILILNPLATHVVARSAYLSGYKVKDNKIADSGFDNGRGEAENI